MRKYLMKRYAMTDKGAKDMITAIITHTFVNLTKLFPPMIGFMFLNQYIGLLHGNDNRINYSFGTYIIIILVMFIVMVVISRIDYVNLFPKIYSESEKYRVEIAQRLKKLPISYFGKRDIADLSATIMSDITRYETLFSHAIPQLYATIISTILISIMVFANNFKMGVAIFWVIPFSYIIFALSRKLQKKSYKELYGSTREIYDDIQEKSDSIQEIKSYNLEEFEMDKFNNKLKKNYKMKVKTELIAGVFLNFSTIFLKFGLISVAVIGANMVVKGELNLLYFSLYMMLSVTIYTPIQGILMNLSLILYLDSIVERINEIRNMPIQEGKTQFNPSGYNVNFENVKFSYDEHSVINGVSFTAKQGEVTALVGPSGSGKTTLTKLAARFWDINSGKITLGGEDISKIDPEVLLQAFSIVFQDVVLFNATVKENIKIGKKDATDEEIEAVIKASRCDEFINRLPNGIETMIGENGSRLSGGERQRISIARALLKDAPIILMDEATASLDVENETKIQEAISELIKNKTVIIIAHRMRTILSADKVVVLDNGEIVEMGKPKDLLNNRKLFYNMVQRQKG